jgi:hypothetical protein
LEKEKKKKKSKRKCELGQCFEVLLLIERNSENIKEKAQKCTHQTGNFFCKKTLLKIVKGLTTPGVLVT